MSKQKVINDIIDRKYYILDDHYNDIKDTNELSDFNRKNYDNFSKLYEDDDNELLKRLYNETEMEILNNQELK